MAEMEAPSQSDAISHLHRMSTTAGVSTQEYVAINNMAVGAILLGLASALMFLADSWVMLAIPLAAVLAAVVAIAQVSRSNGTQTGKQWALLGLGLAVALSGAKWYLDYAEGIRNAPDEKKINAIVAQLDRSVRAGQYDKAYPLFHADFRKQHRLQAFEDRWRGFRASAAPTLGEITALQGNGIVRFYQEGEKRVAATQMLVRFSKPASGGKSSFTERCTVVLREDEAGEFRIAAMPEIFPPPRREAPTD